MNARSLAGRAVALQLAAFAVSCAPQQSSQAASPAAIGVKTVTVERRTIATYESLDGQVDPYLSANLAPQQSGTLVAVYANEGDRVRKGEVLGKIDDSILRATLTQQQGADVQNVAKLSQSKIQLPITTVANDAGFVQAKRAF